MTLTRKDKEKLVLDLYNQGKAYREITRIARICPRDIKTIVQKAENDTESKETLSKTAQAYQMFNEGKSPMEVAITLDLREPEVTQLYRESWNLKQIHDLNQIYLETRGNLAPFLMLYTSSKAAGYTRSNIIWLLETANKGLPELSQRYFNLKSEVNSLEARKQNLLRLIHSYDSQVTALGYSFDNSCLRCKQEEKKLVDLQTKRMKEEVLVRQFENNNGEYLTITKTIEEKVLAAVTNRKKLLELAALSIVESIRENPEKYSSLIPSDTSTDNTFPDFSPYYYMYGPQRPQQQTQSKAYFTEDYVTMLSQDAQKLLEKLVKELGDEVINGHVVSKSASSLLPESFPSSKDFPQTE